MKKTDLEKYTYVYGDKSILDGSVKSFDGHVHFNGDAPLFPQFGVIVSKRLDLLSRGYENPTHAITRVAPLLTRRDAIRLGVSLKDVKIENQLLLNKIGHALTLRRGEDLGIDYLAVTSHDYNAYDEVSQIRDLLDINIELIDGREVTTRPIPDDDPEHKGKHLIAMFARKMPDYGLPVTDVIKFIHDNGGIAIVAHYGMDSSSYAQKALMELVEAGEPPDALEIYTGAMARIDKSRAAMWGRVASRIPALDRKVAKAGANARAINDYEKHYKENFGLSVGSDAHDPRHVAEAIGVYPADMSLQQAIMNGKIVVMRKKQLAISTYWEVRTGGILSRRLEDMRREGVVFDVLTRDQVTET